MGIVFKGAEAGSMRAAGNTFKVQLSPAGGDATSETEVLGRNMLSFFECDIRAYDGRMMSGHYPPQPLSKFTSHLTALEMISYMFVVSVAMPAAGVAMAGNLPVPDQTDNLTYVSIAMPIFIPTTNPNETWGFGPDSELCADGQLKCYDEATQTKWCAWLLRLAVACKTHAYNVLCILRRCSCSYDSADCRIMCWLVGWRGDVAGYARASLPALATLLCAGGEWWKQALCWMSFFHRAS